MTGKRDVFFRSLTVFCILFCSTACGQRNWIGSVGVGDPVDSLPKSKGYFRHLLQAGGLSHWKAEQAPEVGQGIEGMTRLVDGAAEQLWEKGVFKAVFQEFSETDTSNIVEFQHCFFKDGQSADRYFEGECVGGKGADDRRDWGCAVACILTGDYLTQALIKGDRDVLDVRYYGKRESSGSFLKGLEQGILSFGCRQIESMS